MNVVAQDHRVFLPRPLDDPPFSARRNRWQLVWPCLLANLLPAYELEDTEEGSDCGEQCILNRIKRWKFPEPKGGGVCVINYPWVFQPAGGGSEE
jgi:hypothetical protein